MAWMIIKIKNRRPLSFITLNGMCLRYFTPRICYFPRLRTGFVRKFPPNEIERAREKQLKENFHFYCLVTHLSISLVTPLPSLIFCIWSFISQLVNCDAFWLWRLVRKISLLPSWQIYVQTKCATNALILLVNNKS